MSAQVDKPASPRVRHEDSGAVTTKKAPEKPNFWAIMCSPMLSQQFRMFLEKRLCLENLLFYVDVQQYQMAPSDVSDISLLVHAQQICRKFLEDSSPYCLNVDAKPLKAIWTAVESKSVTRTLFADIQTACLSLLQNDSMPKFLASDFYKNTLKPETEIKTKKQQKKSEQRSLKILTDLRDGLMDGQPTTIDLDHECIVQFEAPDIPSLCEAMERQTREDEDWIRQSEAAIALASATVYMQSAPGNDQTHGEILYKDIQNDSAWARQVETIAALFACQSYRRVSGYLSLLGRKWLSWRPSVVAQLEERPLQALPEEEVPFVVSHSVYTTALMNVFEVTRLAMLQFPRRFEFSSDFVVLLLKLTCADLPGVSLLPLLDQDDEDLEIPAFSTLRSLGDFVDEHSAVFKNALFEPVTADTPETSASEELASGGDSVLILPYWNQEQFEQANQSFETWNSSLTSFLLQELLRVDQERQALAHTLVSIHTSKQTNMLYSKEIVSFLQSLKDITDNVVSTPIAPLSTGERKRKRTIGGSDRPKPSRKFLQRNRTVSELMKSTG